MILRENVALGQYTTLKVGGVADYVVEVGNLEELKEACLFAKQTNRPPLILGGGSNVLIGDEGYPGLVIIMNIKGRTYRYEGDQCLLVLGAGEIFDDVVRETCEKSLWGLENLSSIPGSVGATPVQNVGAYGVEVSSLIKKVVAINFETLKEKTFSNDECGFLYRDSFFKSDAGKSWVITSVTFGLSKILVPQLSYADLAPLREQKNVSPQMVRKSIEDIRSQKFPDWHTIGTAGSFFKNPIIETMHYEQLKQQYPELVGYLYDGNVKVSLGWILDKVCGLKGHCEGNVCLFEKQALVLVTQPNATAKDIKSFTKHIQEKVFTATKIKIETEVLFV
ncbi:MAG: UDP-N-acetylmuramate dehydrogenase [Candidatus Pacebacteria bacterium]|nr:UDP-N-acetylmuramate dehydrogenase [Candidatus Paceibacterota bacterium]MBP9842552.1 UDP-N-acetylmuramate dehydrogenase [Candidatus Paceibacterota bacterium]